MVLGCVGIRDQGCMGTRSRDCLGTRGCMGTGDWGLGPHGDWGCCGAGLCQDWGPGLHGDQGPGSGVAWELGCMGTRDWGLELRGDQTTQLGGDQGKASGCYPTGDRAALVGSECRIRYHGLGAAAQRCSRLRLVLSVGSPGSRCRLVRVCGDSSQPGGCPPSGGPHGLSWVHVQGGSRLSAVSSIGTLILPYQLT